MRSDKPFDPLADTTTASVDATQADTEVPAPRQAVDTQGDTEVPNASFDATIDASVTPAASTPRGSPDYSTLVTVNPEHYALDKEIARGGMGRIRLARDRRLGRKVAVKEVLVNAGDLAIRFEREARISARLQHPSIVNVHEAGVWPSGEPFYAMKLVTGRSLDEVVAEARTLDQRLALLPNVLAIADAMAYAHGEHVIHRDLKPRNVLVGAFGETVVIDWGLAKDLSERSSAPDVKHGPFRTTGHDAETEVGDVMGTPQYMPPEQAEGNPVDERADVYAIGAILDHVLAGKPAYTGVNGLEVLEAVKSGPPAPLAERQPGVPADLLAIVDRAMMRDPAARYPTAGELAEDLRRYQTGQLVGAHRYSLRQLLRRWLRRHRAAVTVAGVATLVLLVLSTFALRRIVHAQYLAEEQRAHAEEQRLLAAASRGEAEDLIDFMMGDLRRKLPPGKLDLLDAVSKKAAAYYERRGENLNDAELAKRGVARRNLSEVLGAQGHEDSALQESRAALAIYETLVAKDPTSTAWQHELAVCHRKVGDALRAQLDAAGALAESRKALAISEMLAAKDPTNPEWQRELAVDHGKLGKALRMHGEAEDALREYRACLAIAHSLITRDPADTVASAILAEIHGMVGDLLLSQQDTASALAEFQAQRVIVESLVAKDLKVAGGLTWDPQSVLADNHASVGEVLSRQGDMAGALLEARAEQVILAKLAADDPTFATVQNALARSHQKVGGLLFAKGDTSDALAAYKSSLAISMALAANAPTNAMWQVSIATSREGLGDVALKRGDAAGAVTEYRSERAIFEKLAANDPADLDEQNSLAISNMKVGDALHAQGSIPDALVAYRAGLAIFEKLASRPSPPVEVQQALANAHEHVGDELLAQGDKGAALAEYRAELAIAETLAAKDPANAETQSGLAGSHEKLGDALLAQGNKTEALAEYKKALGIAQRLSAMESQDASAKRTAADLVRKVAACCGAVADTDR